ncbi:hypothetical protein BGZ47_011292 [Haplosporangium gracile]|nr:hypothetical protein BGZ47_011292 [Haplosporangium gracile]
MLLLVPAQNTNEEGGPTTNNQQSTSLSSHFTPTTAIAHSSTSSSSASISTTSGRVLVVLPSHTDLTSKLTVSDSSVLALHSGHRIDNNEDEQLMGYNDRRRSQDNTYNGALYSGMVKSSDQEFDAITTTGYMDGQRYYRHSVQAGSISRSTPYSSSSSSSTSTPFSSNSPLSQHLSFVDSLLGDADSGGGSSFADNLTRRRHSHLGLALGGSSSGMDPDTVAHLRRSSNSPVAASGYTTRRFRSRSSRRASTLAIPSFPAYSTTSTSPYTPTTKNAKMAMAAGRNAARSFQEAFKKSMTVHSPLLTSTSSGMVLDLSPGPEPNVVSSKLRGIGACTASASAAVDESKAAKIGLAVSVSGKQHQQQASIKHGEDSPDVRHRLVPPLFSSSRKRSQKEMVEDLDRGGGGGGVGVGGVKSESMDTASNDNSRLGNNGPPAALQKQKKSGSSSRPSFDTAVISRSHSSSSLVTPVPGPGSVSFSSASQSQSQSPRGSNKSSSSSSPAFAMRSSSLSSPAPVPATMAHRIQKGDELDEEDAYDYYSLNQEQQQQDPLDKVVTAQDISAITASMGALTPLEIQRRLYAHQEKQQKLRKRWVLHHHQQQQQHLLHQQQQQQFSRGSMSALQHLTNFCPLPTTGELNQVQTPKTQMQQQQYRGIVGGNHNGTVDLFGRRTPASTMATGTTTTNTTSPYQQQQYPPHPHIRHPQSHQTQLQTQGSATSSSAPMSHPLHPLYSQQQQQQQQQLPSCYYLPPSAFRTASAVAAEEQLEAERKRKEFLLAALAITTDGEEQTNGRKTDQELEGEKKKVEEEEEEGEEFLTFSSPTLL